MKVGIVKSINFSALNYRFTILVSALQDLALSTASDHAKPFVVIRERKIDHLINLDDVA